MEEFIIQWATEAALERSCFAVDHGKKSIFVKTVFVVSFALEEKYGLFLFDGCTAPLSFFGILQWMVSNCFQLRGPWLLFRYYLATVS